MEQGGRRLSAVALVDGDFLLGIILRVLEANLQLDAADAAVGVDAVDGRLRAVDEAVAQNLGQRAGQTGGLMDDDGLTIVGVGAFLGRALGCLFGGRGNGRGRRFNGGRAGLDGRCDRRRYLSCRSLKGRGDFLHGRLDRGRQLLGRGLQRGGDFRDLRRGAAGDGRQGHHQQKRYQQNLLHLIFSLSVANDLSLRFRYSQPHPISIVSPP